jgi:hypothetical protein
MKQAANRRRWLPMTATWLIAASLSAQEPAIPVPQYDEVFYRYDRAAGKLLELERRTASLFLKPKAMGLGGYQGVLYLKGARSPVRFREGDPLEFVIALPQRAEPHPVQFFAMRQADDRREVIPSTPSKLAAGASKDAVDLGTVQYEIRKYGESGWLITPSTPLPPGEYTLSLPTGNLGYAFAVDRVGPPRKKR